MASPETKRLIEVMRAESDNKCGEDGLPCVKHLGLPIGAMLVALRIDVEEGTYQMSIVSAGPKYDQYAIAAIKKAVKQWELALAPTSEVAN